MNFTVKYDVAVVGAGVAGVAAALAAARRGRKVALLEKQTLIGGLATSGLIYVYLPLCDGRGTQVIAGLSEEMIRRCTEYGPFDVPEKWGGSAGGNPGLPGTRFRCCFSPAGFTLTLDKMLAEAGVDLWLDTVVIDAVREGARVRELEVFNASGRLRIAGGCFVDASGGAFLVQLAGGAVCREANRLTPWVMEMAEDPSFFHFTESLHIQGVWPAGAGDDLDTAKFGTVYPDCSTGKAVSEFVREGWELVRGRYAGTDRRKNYPVHLPAMPQLRKIAAARCRAMLDDDAVCRRAEDSIGMTGDWRAPGPVWETPFGALVPEALDGVFVAGRCIGALREAWEVFRVIPAAAMTGEAAGIAAALAAERGCATRELPAAMVQEELRKLGVPLHLDEVHLENRYRP